MIATRLAGGATHPDGKSLHFSGLPVDGETGRPALATVDELKGRHGRDLWDLRLGTSASSLPIVRRLAMSLLVVAAVSPLSTGCGSGASGPPAAPGVAPVGSSRDCADYLTWRDAQDEMDADAELAADLDSDGDGVACADELGQPEYEEAWSEAYPEACAAVFDESSTGALYGDDGTEFTDTDCESADPGPGDWEADGTSEPSDDGHRDGWQSACDETFGPSVASGDLQLEDEGIDVGQADCESESPY